MVMAKKASIPSQNNEGAADNMTPNTTRSPKGHVIGRSQPLRFAGRVHQAGSAASSKWNKNGRDKPYNLPRTD